MKLKLQEARTRRIEQEVEVKPPLYATRCDACGTVFEMREFYNEKARGELRGTFAGDLPAGQGNQFHAHVCSFHCAHMIAEGGWKTLPEYHPFVKTGADLLRLELCLTRGSLLVTQVELEREWEAQPEQVRQRFEMVGFVR